MSSLNVGRIQAQLLARQAWSKLLPSANLIRLVRQASLIAQQMTNLDTLIRCRDSSSISYLEATKGAHHLEPVAHQRRLPGQQRRCRCSGYSYFNVVSPTTHQLTGRRTCCDSFRTVQQCPSRLYSTTSLLCNCHKSPPELQQTQRINNKNREESQQSRDVQRPTQIFQLIRTALAEDEEEMEQPKEKDHENNIHRNIRPAIAGDPEVVTEKLKELLRGVNHGNRAKLAEAITLIESKHSFKHKQAQWLLTKILSHQSKLKQLEKLKPTVRIGFSGPPGAGKSTLIESFGTMLTSMDYKVAVLAVDPSSSRTGGSILGDKTRMAKLACDPNAYIRPTPSGGSLGGVARNTNEAIILCEAAGYDIILVETVGVGQSEIAVCDMVDMFVLIIPPAAGDELQGIKRGIVELADLVIVNKADGDLLPAARRIKAEYVSALKLLRSKHRVWTPKVLKVSALEKKGMDDIWASIVDFDTKMKRSGEFTEKRKQQQKTWMWAHIELELRHRFKKNPAMAGPIATMERRVMAGSMAPGTAADILLDKFLHSSQN